MRNIKAVEGLLFLSAMVLQISVLISPKVALAQTVDEPEIVLSTPTLGVTEGDDATYTVKLATQPSETVTVLIAGTANIGLMLDKTNLTFNPSGANLWSTAQTVTVSAGQDDDATNETGTLVHTASGGNYTDETASLAVTITDDDKPEIFLSNGSLNLAEGGMARFTVELATQPTATVTVAITGHADTDLMLNKTNLTFNPSGANLWSTAQTVTVSAGQDDDATNDRTVLKMHSSGGDYRVGVGMLVTVIDDDEAGIVLSTPTLGVDEGDDATYTVKLATQPTATVTVAITGHADTDLGLDETNLTFNPSGANLWSTAQTVTVSAGEDLDGANDAATLLHTASGGDYTGETASLAVTTTDDDTPAWTVGVSPSSIAEAGGESTVTVSSGGVTFTEAQTITLALTGTATKTTDYTIDSESLTLTAGKTSITTTVTGVDDTIDDEAETIIITASVGDSKVGTAQTVTITDDDTPAWTVAVNPSAIAEDGGTSTVTVSSGGVSFAEARTITLALTGTATKTTDYTIDSESLTLTAGKTSITTTVTGVDDTIDDEAETIIITASVGDSKVGTAQTVTITDDDTPAWTVAVNPSAIAEDGGTSTVTVSSGGVSFAEARTITLALTGTATKTTDYTIDSESLTLTAGKTSITTTVTGVNDSIDDEAETIVIAASVGGSTVGTAQTVTITDDDEAGIVLSTPTLGVTEGDDATYTVKLATEPTATVTVAITGHADTDLGLDETSLTFNPSGANLWSTDQTVTVSAGEDDDATNDAATLLHTASGGDYTGETASLAVTTTDNERVGIVLSATTLGVTEGDDATYTVKLATEPTATVTVAITGHADTDLGLDETSLTFNPSGANLWSTAQTVTVSAGQDDDATNDAATLLHTASGGDYTGETASLAVTTTDNERVGIVLSATTLGVTEGDDATYTVKLATEPTATVTVAITGHADTDLGLDETNLTFNPSGANLWSTAQTVTVSAGEDLDGANDAATLLHTASGGDYTGETASLAVITTDDDTPAWTLGVNPSAIAEDRGVSTVTVSSGGVSFIEDKTITLALTGTATKTTDYTIDSESLTLAAGETSVTTKVTGVNDSIDDEAETIIIAASIGDSPVGTSTTITITDDDEASFSLSVDPPSIAEDGGASTVTVSTGTVTFTEDKTITLALTGTATKTTDYTIDSESLTLAAGETSVTTTVTGVNDSIDDEAETIIIAASIGDSPVGTSTTITITDDDEASFSLSVDPPSIAEDGGASTVTVSTGTVTFTEDKTITLALTGTATKTTDYTIDSESLTLTAGKTSVTTEVTGVNDSIDDEAETIIIAASIGDSPVGTSTTITITDDDEASFSLSVDPPSIAEDGGASTVTVSTGTVTFTEDKTITLALTGTATKTTDYTIDSESLTLTAGKTSVTTEVTGVNDSIDDEAETIIIAASIGDSPVGTSTTITITDDDEASFSLSVDPPSIAEDGGASTVTVSTGTVTFTEDKTITLALTGTATKTTDYTIDSESLTLTAGKTSVTTEVTGVNDSIDDEAETIIIAASIGDSPVGTSTTITITDDDEASFSLSVDPPSIAEDGGASTVTVSTGTVTFTEDKTITLALTGTATKTTDYTIDSESLTLTAGKTSVTTEVTGVNDSIDDEAETIVIAASVGSSTVGTAQTVTITDDDEAGIVLSTLTLGLAEGDDATYTVKLATQPTATVTVAITGHAGTDLTPDETSLTFNPSGANLWSTDQTVTVSAGEDDDATNDVATLLHTASGGDYTGETARLAVTTTDNERVGIVLSALTLGVTEGDNAICTVALATEPTQTVTIAITGHEDTDLTLDKNSLTFTTTNWSMAQTVTLEADQDDDTLNDTVTLLHTASGGDYESKTAELSVTITDDDELGAKFVNISTRALVETGDEVMIGGFIIEEGDQEVLIQALGPELANKGISNALADTVLTVIQTAEGDGAARTPIDPPIEITVNDNWQDDDQGQTISDLWGGRPPLTAGSLSSAAFLELGPGGYTAKVEGKDGTTGVAIVEIYRIESNGTESSSDN